MGADTIAGCAYMEQTPLEVMHTDANGRTLGECQANASLVYLYR
jgi:hypothetical protein